MNRLAICGLLAIALTTAASAAQVTHYLVGPHDVLAVSVYDQPDLTGKYAVEADGTFTFPLVGRVKVGGLPLRDIEQLLRQELANGFLRNPQVSVAVEQYRSQRVFVVGEVRTPGAYPLTGDMNVIEVLARAGSTTDSASGHVLIVRPRPSRPVEGPTLPNAQTDAEVIEIDIEALQSGKRAQNAQLQHNDTIVVPRVERVYVLGQVRNPGSYPLPKHTTVLQALALAGGITDRGSSGRIRIVRQDSRGRTELRAKLEDIVLPGDSIVVLERFF